MEFDDVICTSCHKYDYCKKYSELNRKNATPDGKRYSPQSPIRNCQAAICELHYTKVHNKDVLEVGCGPYGVINFANCWEGLKVGIDPEPHLNIWKTQSIRIPHVVAVGEFLPLRDMEVDIVICFNVLDHVLIPQKVVNEITRVLKRKGKLLLWVVTIRNFLKGLGAVLNNIDTPHPHHLTLQEILDFLHGEGLEVTRIYEGNFQKGGIFSNFKRAVLKGRFKVDAANFLVCNAHIIAEKQ